jgi:hypothetical protein
MVTWFVGEMTMAANYKRAVPFINTLLLEPGNVMAQLSLLFRLLLLCLICVGPWQLTVAQPADISTVSLALPLTAEQVVQNLVRMNQERAQALRAYRVTRIYRLEYHGFPRPRNAEMIVDVKYESPRTKEFVIQSATGSKLIIEKVLKKLLQSEQEALEADNQQRTALSNDNYIFHLLGYEAMRNGPAYVLSVEPRTKDKFLYRGRIWVDAEDFAVVQIEAEPAKNPSFWTKKAEIVQLYTKVSDFWLPAYNHSVSAIRLGGHAELNIEYKAYEIADASRVSSLSMLRSTLHAQNARAQE